MGRDLCLASPALRPRIHKPGTVSAVAPRAVAGLKTRGCIQVYTSCQPKPTSSSVTWGAAYQSCDLRAQVGEVINEL